MAVHDHRSSDHHHTAASAVLGAFGKFYDSAGAFRCAFLNLAARIRLSKLVERPPTFGAARTDELRREPGDVGAYAFGHRSGSLQRHLAKASWTKGIAVIHAHQPDAAGDRFRDSAVRRVLAREPGEHTSGSDLGRYDSHGSVRLSHALRICAGVSLRVGRSSAGGGGKSMAGVPVRRDTGDDFGVGHDRHFQFSDAVG